MEIFKYWDTMHRVDIWTREAGADRLETAKDYSDRSMSTE